MAKEELGAFEELEKEIRELKKARVKWVNDNRPGIIVLAIVSMAGWIIGLIGATVYIFLNERDGVIIYATFMTAFVLFLLIVLNSCWQAMKKERVKIESDWEELKGRVEKTSDLTDDEKKELRVRLDSILLITNMKVAKALRDE